MQIAADWVRPFAGRGSLPALRCLSGVRQTQRPDTVFRGVRVSKWKQHSGIGWPDDLPLSATVDLLFEDKLLFGETAEFWDFEWKYTPCKILAYRIVGECDA